MITTLSNNSTIDQALYLQYATSERDLLTKAIFQRQVIEADGKLRKLNDSQVLRTRMFTKTELSNFDHLISASIEVNYQFKGTFSIRQLIFALSDSQVLEKMGLPHIIEFIALFGSYTTQLLAKNPDFLKEFFKNLKIADCYSSKITQYCDVPFNDIDLRIMIAGYDKEKFYKLTHVLCDTIAHIVLSQTQKIISVEDKKQLSNAIFKDTKKSTIDTENNKFVSLSFKNSPFQLIFASQIARKQLFDLDFVVPIYSWLQNQESGAPLFCYNHDEPQAILDTVLGLARADEIEKIDSRGWLRLILNIVRDRRSVIKGMEEKLFAIFLSEHTDYKSLLNELVRRIGLILEDRLPLQPIRAFIELIMISDFLSQRMTSLDVEYFWLEIKKYKHVKTQKHLIDFLEENKDPWITHMAQGLLKKTIKYKSLMNFLEIIAFLYRIKAHSSLDDHKVDLSSHELDLPTLLLYYKENGYPWQLQLMCAPIEALKSLMLVPKDALAFFEQLPIPFFDSVDFFSLDLKQDMFLGQLDLLQINQKQLMHAAEELLKSPLVIFKWIGIKILIPLFHADKEHFLGKIFEQMKGIVENHPLLCLAFLNILKCEEPFINQQLYCFQSACLVLRRRQIEQIELVVQLFYRYMNFFVRSEDLSKTIFWLVKELGNKNSLENIEKLAIELSARNLLNANEISAIWLMLIDKKIKHRITPMLIYQFVKNKIENNTITPSPNALFIAICLNLSKILRKDRRYSASEEVLLWLKSIDISDEQQQKVFKEECKKTFSKEFSGVIGNYVSDQSKISVYLKKFNQETDLLKCFQITAELVNYAGKFDAEQLNIDKLLSGYWEKCFKTSDEKRFISHYLPHYQTIIKSQLYNIKILQQLIKDLNFLTSHIEEIEFFKVWLNLLCLTSTRLNAHPIVKELEQAIIIFLNSDIFKKNKIICLEDVTTLCNQIIPNLNESVSCELFQAIVSNCIDIKPSKENVYWWNQKMVLIAKSSPISNIRESSIKQFFNLKLHTVSEGLKDFQSYVELAIHTLLKQEKISEAINIVELGRDNLSSTFEDSLNIIIDYYTGKKEFIKALELLERVVKDTRESNWQSIICKLLENSYKASQYRQLNSYLQKASFVKFFNDKSKLLGQSFAIILEHLADKFKIQLNPNGIGKVGLQLIELANTIMIKYVAYFDNNSESTIYNILQCFYETPSLRKKLWYTVNKILIPHNIFNSKNHFENKAVLLGLKALQAEKDKLFFLKMLQENNLPAKIFKVSPTLAETQEMYVYILFGGIKAIHKLKPDEQNSYLPLLIKIRDQIKIPKTVFTNTPQALVRAGKSYIQDIQSFRGGDEKLNILSTVQALDLYIFCRVKINSEVKSPNNTGFNIIGKLKIISAVIPVLLWIFGFIYQRLFCNNKTY